MGFSSVIYIFIFFPMAVIGYFFVQKISYLLIRRDKADVADFLNKLCLIGISIIFYAWAGIMWINVILIMIALLWIAGVAVENAKQKRNVLILSTGFLLEVLTYFNYSGFIINNVNRFIGTNFTYRILVAPAGLSFMVFSAISYLFDIYLKKATSGRIIDTYLYILFFQRFYQGQLLNGKIFRVR